MEVQMENLLISRALVVLLDRQTIGRQAARNQPHRVDEVSKLVRDDVENIARGRFGDDDGVFRGTRPHVEERKHLVVLVDLMTRHFPAQDLGEYVVRVVAR
jgi:hypothetical protein